MNCKRFAIKRKYKNELELILYLKKKKKRFYIKKINIESCIKNI